jgi:hypothetical protein
VPPPTREDVEEALRALDVPGARAAVQTIRLYLIHEDRPSRRRDVEKTVQRETDGKNTEPAQAFRDLRAENDALKADNASLLAVAIEASSARGAEVLRNQSRPGAALLERMRKMEEALRTIARWDRETFPRVPDPANPQLTTSYGFAYGSNGELDYMRQIALDALEEK